MLRCRSVTRSYYRGAAGAILVYDITEYVCQPLKRPCLIFLSRSTFVNLSRWLQDARALASPHLVTILVGNKSDREDEREVEWSEASRWAAENGEPSAHWEMTACDLILLSLQDVHFIETSSLYGDNVEAPFLLAARSILLSIESGVLDPEKAGSGVSYGDRALRRFSSSSRLSFGSESRSSSRRGVIKVKLKDIGRGRCC